MTKRSNQALMTSSNSDNRQQAERQAATDRASDRDGIDFVQIPIMATQHLAPGEILTIINDATDDIHIDLDSSSWSIPCGERQAFGPFQSSHLTLTIRPIKDGRPGRPLSTIKIKIAPIAEFGGKRGINGEQEATWKWDGSQIWRISIPCQDEQPERIAR